jgi:hypothetical protein
VIRFAALTALVTALGMSSLPPSTADSPVGCRDGWNPPVGHRIDVRNVDSLERAVRGATSGDTIILADGDYPLRRMLDIAVPNVTVRGKSGDLGTVTLHGRGMTHDTVGVGISVSAPNVTVADITIRDVRFHGIQVRGERAASGFTLHHARLLDTGQQLLKISVGTNGLYADDGLVACSDFGYTTSAPTDYTNGVDLLATKGWTIRDNRFTRIRGPEAGRWASGPTILAWQAAEDTVVERNVIVDSFRGIALGLVATPGKYARHGAREYDHVRGIVRNNVIVNLNAWADEAIEANAARDVRIEHNTVLVASRASPWSIGVRFPSGSASVRNNLTNQPILRRSGGRTQADGNVSVATPSWFIDPRRADLHLSPAGAAAIGAGVPISDVVEDFDRTPRVAGKAPDAGAFESRTARSGGPQ